MGSALAPGDLGRRARGVALDAAWRQWTALGASGGAAPQSGTLLDPEALVLASAQLVAHERRLGDFLRWWAETGAAFGSVQRTRSLLRVWPEGAAEALSAFAASAVAAGDRRWAPLAGPEPLDARPGKGAAAPVVTHPSALVLRLRAAFGGSAKADLLAVLLGSDRPQTVRALAEATGYSTVAVRVALGEMALARVAEATGATPTAYRVAEPGLWAGFVGGRAVPRWGHWAEAYAVLLDVADWGARADAGAWSPYVAGSKARDLLERHAGAVRRWVPDAPRARTLVGEGAGAAAVIEALVDAVRAAG